MCTSSKSFLSIAESLPCGGQRSEQPREWLHGASALCETVMPGNKRAGKLRNEMAKSGEEVGRSVDSQTQSLASTLACT